MVVVVAVVARLSSFVERTMMVAAGEVAGQEVVA